MLRHVALVRTSQKMPFFIVTAVKTSNLTCAFRLGEYRPFKLSDSFLNCLGKLQTLQGQTECLCFRHWHCYRTIYSTCHSSLDSLLNWTSWGLCHLICLDKFSSACGTEMHIHLLRKSRFIWFYKLWTAEIILAHYGCLGNSLQREDWSTCSSVEKWNLGREMDIIKYACVEECCFLGCYAMRFL
jgi:hypothetical protein